MSRQIIPLGRGRRVAVRPGWNPGTSAAPAVDSLPWLRRAVPERTPEPAPEARLARTGFLFPAPAAVDSLPWLRRLRIERLIDPAPADVRAVNASLYFTPSVAPEHNRIINLLGYDATQISLTGDNAGIDLLGYDATQISIDGDDT